MKKTSYFLLALAAGLIAASIIYPVHKIRKMVRMELKHEILTIPIEASAQIEEVEYSMTISKAYQSYIHNGLRIELSDTVSHPYITIDSIFSKYIGIDHVGNRLKINLTFDDEKNMQSLDSAILLITDDEPVRLVMPRHPLRRISSTYGRLEIRDLETQKLTMFSNGGLNMTRCRIDSLIESAGGDAKMTFRDCNINYMRLSMEDDFIKINCCDSSSIIRKVDFIAREGIKTNVFLNEANIDTFRWDPPTPTQLTVRIKHPINIVK